MQTTPLPAPVIRHLERLSNYDGVLSARLVLADVDDVWVDGVVHGLRDPNYDRSVSQLLSLSNAGDLRLRLRDWSTLALRYVTGYGCHIDQIVDYSREGGLRWLTCSIQRRFKAFIKATTPDAWRLSLAEPPSPDFE